MIDLRRGKAGDVHDRLQPIPGRVPIDLAMLEGKLRIDRGMQRAQMMLVDRVLGALQPVAIFLVGADDGEPGFAEQQIPARENGRRLRAEIGEDESAGLGDLIARELHAVLEAAAFGLERRVDALPGAVVLPAVIAAANAFRLDTAEFERHAAMRAIPLKEAEPAGRIAEEDKVFAEQPHRHRLRWSPAR